MQIVLLDGYELNQDLNWDALKELGECTFYDRTPVADTTEILRRIGDAEIVITHKTPLTAELLAQTSKLRYIGIMGTGSDIVNLDKARRRGITVTTVPAYATEAVAQFTFALLLEATSHVGLHNQLVHDGQWSQSPDFTFWQQPLMELKGKTMGIIGFGRIAREVAKIAHAFSMNVVFYNHRPKRVPEMWVHQLPLDIVLKRSDVISLNVSLTPETAGMINAETLATMKSTAIIVNTARGQLINEDDVAAALNDGRLGALATDVVSSEPIAADNPLLTAQNCFITPHIAWAAHETRTRLLDITIENLQAYLDGTPINQVDD